MYGTKPILDLSVNWLNKKNGDNVSYLSICSSLPFSDIKKLLEKLKTILVHAQFWIGYKYKTYD